jgi:hypothetical protein
MSDINDCCECGGNIFTCICDSSLPAVQTPEEAVDWKARYVFAHEVKEGDYLVDMATFQKVYSVRTFEPYDSVQIKAGKINYSKRKTNGVWVLQKPEEA